MSQIELFQDDASLEPVVVHEIDLFDPEVVRAARFFSGDRDAIERDKKIAEQLISSGHRRRLVTPTVQVERSIRDLGEEFPNMVEVANYLADEALLARNVRQPYQPMPCLLIGPPGMGKTEFTSRFADAIGVGEPLEISFETAQTVSQLAGSERHWGNSAPGRLFSTLANGPVASPVVLLEELDKASRTHGDPTAPLLSLLEQRTASRWHDLCCDWLPMNASRVIWLGSANERDGIPAPVLSRFQVFEIRPLADEDLLRIAHKLFAKLNESHALGFSTMTKNFADALVTAYKSPRELRQAIRRAAVSAMRSNRRELIPADVPTAKHHQLQPAQRIGFI